MSKRAYGRADITQPVKFFSEKAGKHFHGNFAKNSVSKGSVEILNFKLEKLDHLDDLIFYVRFTHTADNKSNHRSDSERFVKNTMSGTSYRYEILPPILHSWTPLPRPAKPLRRPKDEAA